MDHSLNSEEFAPRLEPLWAAHASPEATKGPGTSPARLLVCLRETPAWGRGLWGQLHPPGGASPRRREVILPPGMDEEAEPSSCPEEWAKLQGITRQHVAPVRGKAVPDSPAREMGFLGFRSQSGQQGVGGRWLSFYVQLWLRLATDPDQCCHVPGPWFPCLSLGFCGFSLLRHVHRPVKHTDLELEFWALLLAV